MDTRDIFYLVGLALTALSIVATIIYRTSALGFKLGILETTVKSLHDWMVDFKRGDAPVCARHGQTLKDHARRLRRLENGHTPLEAEDDDCDLSS